MGSSHESSTVEVAPTRLNPTDAALWDIERNPALRTTIVGAMLLDRPVDRDRLRAVLEVATRRIPRLRQRVVSRPGGVGTPHWEIVGDFDLDRHVRVVPSPEGVDVGLIAQVASPMAAAPFDRDRPLWELTYLDPPSGRSAVVLKVHHSLTDGVGGIDLLDVILDRRRRARRPDPDAFPVPIPGSRPPTDRDDVARTVRKVVDLPFDVAGAATTGFFHPVRTATGAWEGVRSAGRLLAPSSAPLSPIMTERGTGRYAGTCEFGIERLHDAAARHGCTINHAFFAGVVGGIAAYHRELGADLRRLRVTMPISFRSTGDGAAGNQWAPVRFVVPTDVDDPVERMLAMRALVVASRREKALSFSHTLAGLVQMLPSALSSAVVGGMMHGVDVTLTNVPGLTEPHYLAGASVERLFAFAPTAGAALNVGLVSHLDTACLGTLSDATAVTEPDLLHESIAAGMEHLLVAAESRAPSRPTQPLRPTAPEPSAVAADRPDAPDRLTALDTGFLRLESPDTPMAIGGVFLLDGSRLRDEDGRIRIDDARDHVAARLERLPRFRRRLAEVPLRLGRPVWVDDERFDIARHVRLVTAAGDGGRDDLLRLCAELFATPLDREHPLWDLAFVDGLADGRVGIVERVHHALIDGVSGVELAAAIFDLDEVAEPDHPAPERSVTPPPGAPKRLLDALVEQAADPVAVVRDLMSAARTPARLADQLGATAAAAREIVGRRAPDVPFNGEIGRSRELRAVTVSIDAVRSAGSAADATVNDVVLGSVAGALRRWFHAEHVEPVDVHVLVPVSTRSHALGDGAGNEVGAVLVELPVGEPDPIRRLDLVHRRMLRLKTAHEGEGTAHLLDAIDHVPSVWHTPLTRFVATQQLVNLVVTNVPGPPVPLHFLGARVDEIVPVVPLGARLGLGVAVLSYCDQLTVSLFADPESMADLDVLADALATEFEGILGATAS